MDTHQRQQRAALIVTTLEMVGERCDDIAETVYRRLYRARPETESMFRRETNNLVKGSMLELAIDAILDFAGDQKQSYRMIQCEVQSHEAYGTPPDLFGVFFHVIAETARDSLAADWTPDMAEAWRSLLAELDFFVAHPNEPTRAVAAL
jgi:hemoglobin-like flavoprotein